jgi:hypothetical protein
VKNCRQWNLAITAVPLAGTRANVVQLCRLPNERILAGTATADFLRLAEPHLVVVAPSARPAPASGSLAAVPAPDCATRTASISGKAAGSSGALMLTSDGAGWGMTR